MIDFFDVPNLLDFLQVGWFDDAKSNLSSLYNETGSTINSFMIDLINTHLLNYGGRLSNHLIGVACALGAIFAICVAAAKAYKVMAKGDDLDILDIIRPLGFAFVLSVWPAVCNTLVWPGKYIESFMRAEYIKAAQEMDNLQEDRKTLALDVFEDITKKKAAADEAKEGKEREWYDVSGHVADAIGAVTSWMGDILTVGIIHISYWLEWVIVQIGQMVFCVCVYIVFMVKVLYLTVLWMFGPVYMVCSILDVWKNSWSDWVGRVVSVSMYGAMAYLVMTFSCYMICMTLQADINKLNTIRLHPEIGMGEYLKSGFGTTIMTFVGYMTGAIAMGTVYELASFTFPGGPMMGASSFIGGMKRYATKYSGTNKLFG